MPTDHRNYVGGEWIESESGEVFEVRNPADADEVVSRFQASVPADIDVAIATAVEAREDWAELPGPERGRILHQTSLALEERKDEATGTLVREEGKTRSEAAGEVQRAVDIFG